MTVETVRQALLDANHSGVVWEELVHQVNVLAGRRVLSLWTLRRFAVQGRNVSNATFGWLERWAVSRAAAPEVAAS